MSQNETLQWYDDGVLTALETVARLMESLTTANAASLLEELRAWPELRQELARCAHEWSDASEWFSAGSGARRKLGTETLRGVQRLRELTRTEAYTEVARLVTSWMTESTDAEPQFAPEQVEPLDLRRAA